MHFNTFIDKFNSNYLTLSIVEKIFFNALLYNVNNKADIDMERNIYITHTVNTHSSILLSLLLFSISMSLLSINSKFSEIINVLYIYYKCIYDDDIVIHERLSIGSLLFGLLNHSFWNIFHFNPYIHGITKTILDYKKEGGGGCSQSVKFLVAGIYLY